MKGTRRASIVGLFVTLCGIIGFGLGMASPQNGFVEVYPDFRPRWAADTLNTIRTDVARSNDRLVSCKDWTVVDPTPITGQRVISFVLDSPNLGIGHFRTRRETLPEGGGFLFHQNVSYIDGDGQCQSFEIPIAIVPTGPGQAGRWLPLGQFALYTVAENGGLGDQVVCQMKRWCCLVSISTCSVGPPCSLPCQGDCINAGTRDTYPFHWLDQFIPIEGVETGFYWIEHVVNPAGIFIESNYDNNAYYILIYLDQEENRVTVYNEPQFSCTE